jgi:predicted enzyme related to lactoylglutathione lyase
MATVKANIDIVLDCSDPETLAEFWATALDYRVLGSADQYTVLVPNEGVKPPLVFQRVPERKNGKNRMHVDILSDDIEKEATRLEELGARRLHSATKEEHGTRWIPMADPEGNEFCVCPGIEW